MHFYSFFTSALDGGGFHAPAALSLGKNVGTNLNGGRKVAGSIPDGVIGIFH